jgi:hypothetical protein
MRKDERWRIFWAVMAGVYYILAGLSIGAALINHSLTTGGLSGVLITLGAFHQWTSHRP